MIGYITGIIKSVDEKSLTILTSAGVGYKVFSPINLLLSKNEEEEIEIFVHTVVKDDAIDLYGFIEEKDLKMFEKLITVSGIGPRSALNILSVSNTEDVALAVENSDADALSNIPGLGKKGREKIVIELKGKLTHFIKEGQEKTSFGEESDAKLALLSLGYNEKDINEILKDLKKNDPQKFEDKQANEIIKEVLKYLR